MALPDSISSQVEFNTLNSHQIVFTGRGETSTASTVIKILFAGRKAQLQQPSTVIKYCSLVEAQLQQQPSIVFMVVKLAGRDASSTRILNRHQAFFPIRGGSFNNKGIEIQSVIKYIVPF
ncbi:hypothetical protein CEXT_552941 [Caerostris extrusa]|uniref:Uncharacterized protein n=1 Tax=Caerostris extrusa TaxID=172846 RepID=A0AAV4VRR0_CAEEX|nr:hypothetical protein CEXT_552941 [Caerostris extrusa]